MFADVFSRLSSRWPQRRKARPQHFAARRLNFESLEGRRLLSGAGFKILITPSTPTAGVPALVTVTPTGVTGAFTDTIDFSTTDPKAKIPLSPYTFKDALPHDFVMTFDTVAVGAAGTPPTLTLTDTTAGTTITPQTVAVPVVAGPFEKLLVSGPTTFVGGTPGSITVTAQDHWGNTVTNYQDTVQFSSSDPLAILPATQAFKATSKGTETFSVTLMSKAKAASITVTDTDAVNHTSGKPITGKLKPIDVLPGLSTVASVTLVPTAAEVTAGTPATVSVTAVDANGKPVGTGPTVHFTSTDPLAKLPPDIDLSLFAGHRTISATFRTAGSQVLTVSDAVTHKVLGTVTIKVDPAAATTIVVAGPTGIPTASPPMVKLGAAENVVVTVYDKYGNVDTGYTGTVSITSSDHGATVSTAGGTAPLTPAYTYAFQAGDNGTHTFSVTFSKPGYWKIYVTDTVTASIKQAYALFGVTP